MTRLLDGLPPPAKRDSTHSAGPFALQYGAGANTKAPGGAIRWRKVEIREL